MKLLLNKNQFAYNLALYQVGYERCAPNHSFGPVIRDFYVMHLIVSGQGFLEKKNKTIALKTGDIFLVPTNEPVRYYANSSMPYEYYWVGFYGVSASEILRKIGFLNNGTLVISSKDKFQTLLTLFKEINTYEDEKSMKENLNMLGIFYQILGALIPNNIEYKEDSQEADVIQKLIKYIEFNYSVPISMATLEGVAHMHRSNIYRLFMKNYGMSPSDYLQEYRLDKALYLLKNSNYSIKQISMLVGYSNSPYFCHIFHKKYLKTPTEVRSLA